MTVITDSLDTVRSLLEGKKCLTCDGTGDGGVRSSCSWCYGTGLDPVFDKLRALFVSDHCQDCKGTIDVGACNFTHDRYWQDSPKGALDGSIKEVLLFSDQYNEAMHGTYTAKYLARRIKGMESQQAAVDALIEALTSMPDR